MQVSFDATELVSCHSFCKYRRGQVFCGGPVVISSRQTVVPTDKKQPQNCLISSDVTVKEGLFLSRCAYNVVWNTNSSIMSSVRKSRKTSNSSLVICSSPTFGGSGGFDANATRSLFFHFGGVMVSLFCHFFNGAGSGSSSYSSQLWRWISNSPATSAGRSLWSKCSQLLKMHSSSLSTSRFPDSGGRMTMSHVLCVDEYTTSSTASARVVYRLL